MFEESVLSIGKFYKEYDYKLGWRFLNCSKKEFDENPQIAFITLNPGGNSTPKAHPWTSFVDGCSYLSEKCGNTLLSKSNLQARIQLQCSILAKKMKYPGSLEEGIEESLSGYFIPFRTSILADLKYKNDAFDFGDKL